MQVMGPNAQHLLVTGTNWAQIKPFMLASNLCLFSGCSFAWSRWNPSDHLSKCRVLMIQHLSWVMAHLLDKAGQLVQLLLLLLWALQGASPPWELHLPLTTELPLIGSTEPPWGHLPLHPQHETSLGLLPGQQVWDLGLPSSSCRCSSPVTAFLRACTCLLCWQHKRLFVWCSSVVWQCWARGRGWLGTSSHLWNVVIWIPSPSHQCLCRGKVSAPALPSHSAPAQPVKPRHDPKCVTDSFIFVAGTGTLEMPWVSYNICISHSLGCFPNGTLRVWLQKAKERWPSSHRLLRQKSSLTFIFSTLLWNSSTLCSQG